MQCQQRIKNKTSQGHIRRQKTRNNIKLVEKKNGASDKTHHLRKEICKMSSKRCFQVSIATLHWCHTPWREVVCLWCFVGGVGPTLKCIALRPCGCVEEPHPPPADIARQGGYKSLINLRLLEQGRPNQLKKQWSTGLSVLTRYVQPQQVASPLKSTCGPPAGSYQYYGSLCGMKGRA